MIAPDSKMLIGSPPPTGAVSTMAGMRVLGLIFRKSSVNWSPWPMRTGTIR